MALCVEASKGIRLNAMYFQLVVAINCCHVWISEALMWYERFLKNCCCKVVWLPIHTFAVQLVGGGFGHRPKAEPVQDDWPVGRVRVDNLP